MTKGFTGIHRVGHTFAGHKAHAKRTPDTSCTTGGFYKTPTNNQIIDSDYPVNLTWDNTCLDAKDVDIYLYAPGSTQSRIYLWESVDFASASFSEVLKPKWWNATSNQALQFLIVPSGNLPYTSTLPGAPIFNATYTPSASNAANADTSHPDSGITNFAATAAAHKSLTSGKIAAGILIPLLFIAAVGAAYYLKMSRAKRQDRSKRFSEMVDKRMSTISHDWQAMSGAGANAAVRASMAIPRGSSDNRISSFSFGAVRPISTVAVEDSQSDAGMAGVGKAIPRPGFRPGMGERVSRVSFADGTRPSGEYRRGVSRAFHTAVVPPLPTRQDSDMVMSPTQTQGARTLSPDEIYRVSTANMEDVMPALSMMRTGGSDTAHELILPPTPPAPVQMKSPVGSMPMQPMPVNVMSPDDMLRAYAERRPSTPSGTSFNNNTGHTNISFPMPAVQTVNYDGNGMRTLYSPVTPATPSSAQPMMIQHAQFGEEAYDYNHPYAGVGNAE